MIQTTRTPKGTRTSIVLPPLHAVATLLFIGCSISTLRYFWRKKRSLLAAEPCLDAGHDVRQVGLGDLVVRLTPLLLAGHEARALHEPQVFGGHVAGDAACLGQLPDRVAAPQEHLNHAQPVR